MRIVVAALLAAGMLSLVLLAQPPVPAPKTRLTFEAASVKLAKSPPGVTVEGGRMMSTKGTNTEALRNKGGPGTDDPGRIHYPLISMTDLLRHAWYDGDLAVEIRGPGWLDTQTYAVNATMPPDTTKDQFREMLRNLIIGRFRLTYHIETKEVAGFSLLLAKNGPKMKVSADQGESAPGPPGQPASRDADGFPVLPARAGAWCVSFEVPGDRHCLVCQQQTMQTLARLLTTPNSIVTDATGLTSKFDFTLTYSGGKPGSPPALPAALSSTLDLPEGVAPLPDIFSTIQSQLGLRLEPKKVAVDVMVVDHIEKTPGGN